MTWKISVDDGRCMASGMCVNSAPDNFELTGLAARVRTPEVEPDDELLDVADLCPAMAITITDGDQTLAP